MSTEEIASSLLRSPDTIRTKARMMGLHRRVELQCMVHPLEDAEHMRRWHKEIGEEPYVESVWNYSTWIAQCRVCFGSGLDMYGMMCVYCEGTGIDRMEDNL